MTSGHLDILNLFFSPLQFLLLYILPILNSSYSFFMILLQLFLQISTSLRFNEKKRKKERNG